MSFLGIFKALYSYTPQSDQELAIEENDILYLLERSDVDDWWTVKKRIVGADVDEPVGLVPSNYIEEADVISAATALYDYEKQTEEELTFKEGDVFDVYDDKDPDWILVSKNKQEFGFVPSNYIEMKKDVATAPSAILPPPSHPSIALSKAEISNFQPPPQRVDSAQQQSSQDDNEVDQPPLPSVPRPTSDDDYDSSYKPSRRDSTRRSSYSNNYDEDDAPPPKPNRPSESNSRRDSYRDSEPSRTNYDDEDDQLYTWQVSEVDGRKKKKAMLAIGNSTIYFSPDSVNGGTPQQWKIKDLITYSSEKKHVFMEFKNPLYSLEIHAGTKDVAANIISILGELKGVTSSSLLKEVQSASASKGPKKSGKILYDFEAQGSDELTVYEGDAVYIINDKKSKDWWMVESVKTGRSGVVPSQFVEPVKESSSSSLVSKFKLGRSKSKDNLKSPSKKKQESESPSKKLATPKPSRVRTWEDRSGSFKVDAEFLGVVEGKIHLHKTNGVKIAVAAPKLSLVDLEYVERVTGMSLESYKSTSKSKNSKSSNQEDKERKERRERERKRREREDRLREQDDKDRQRDREERERDRQRDREERERDRQRDQEERDYLRKELNEAKRLAVEAKNSALDIPPQQPARPVSSSSKTRSRSGSIPSKPAYDWFEFFLEAGVDVNQCQRYTSNFQNEQIDPSIIESIDSTILRTLGLREGDIIRVTRYLDQKFNRQPKEASASGGLFSEPSGALKVNRTGSASQVGDSLPAPTPKSDDDAWTVKPAVNNEQDATRSSSIQTPQFTGSMQDLVNLKPLQPTATASSVKSNPATYAPVSSKVLEPVKAEPSVVPQKTGEITAQATGMVPLDPFKTGGGNILPLTTGGAFVYLPIQQTGAIMQSNGLMPLQRTGGLNPAFTGGLVPLQKTGGLVPLQKTGGLNPVITGGLLPLQKTGQLNGGFPTFGSASTLPPATTFGTLPPALTGGLPAALTGGISQPFNSFQPTGGIPAALTGGLSQPFNNFQSTGALPQTSFGAPQTSFGGAPQTSFGSQPTPSFPQTSFGIQPTGFAQQPTGFAQQPTAFNSQPNLFQQQATGFNQPATTFGQQPLFGQPQSNQFSLSSPPTFNTQAPGLNQAPTFNQQLNQLTSGLQNTSLQPFSTGFQAQAQQTSFANFQQQPQPQPTFGGFGQQQPLEAQPTGFGFGNSSGTAQSFGQTQPAQFGQRANLANATADNPFGF